MSQLEGLPPAESISFASFARATAESLIADGMSREDMEAKVLATKAAFRTPVRKILESPAPEGGRQASAA